MEGQKESTGAETVRWVTIKVPRGIAARVQANKKKTMAPVGRFFELAAAEKLDRENGALFSIEDVLVFYEWKQKYYPTAGMHEGLMSVFVQWKKKQVL